MRESCECDDGPAFIPISETLAIIHERHGMENLKRSITTEKKDFRGRRLTVCSSDQFEDRWESRWRPILHSFNLRMAHMYTAYAFGSLLQPLRTMHNFTFDMSCQEYFRHPEGGIMMRISRSGLDNTFVEPLSLASFEHLRTLSFSKLTPVQPCRLYVLRCAFLS